MAKWAVAEINRLFHDYKLYTVIVSGDGLKRGFLTRQEIKDNNWKFRKVKNQNNYHCYDKDLDWGNL